MDEFFDEVLLTRSQYVAIAFDNLKNVLILVMVSSAYHDAGSSFLLGKQSYEKTSAEGNSIEVHPRSPESFVTIS